MKGNRGIVEEAFSPNFAFHSHTHVDPPLRGLEGARVMTSASGLAETQVTIEDIFGEGDRVAVRWTFRGIYRGAPKPGYPQPGERSTVVAISTYRFVDGKKRGRLGSTSVLGRPYAVGVTRNLFPTCAIQPPSCAYPARHSKDDFVEPTMPARGPRAGKPQSFISVATFPRERFVVLGRSIGKYSG
jgi:hypothetical protein